MNGLKAFLDQEQAYLVIKQKHLYIYTQSSTRSIPLTDIMAMQTKNESDTCLLKVKLSNENIILTFLNFNIRDLAKSLILSNMNNGSVHKEIDFDTSNFINSLSPPFLTVFSDMNCTVSQFYNYLKQSNFYDVRNNTTPVDRLITENLRNFKLNADNSLVRINNYSMLTVNEDIPVVTPSFVETKEIEFLPIYNFEDEKEESVIEDTEIEIEKSITDIRIDKKDLKKILDATKKVFRDEVLDEGTIQWLRQFENISVLNRILPKGFCIKQSLEK